MKDLRLNKVKKRSILRRFLLTAIIIVFMQIIIIWIAISISRVMPNLNDNAYEILEKTVNNRKNYLESEMHNRWSSIQDNIPLLLENYQKLNISGKVFTEQESWEYLDSCVPELIAMLRDTNSTGVFIILNDNTEKDPSHSSLYFKDYDPYLNDISNSDVFALKGSYEILKNYKMPFDTSWSLTISFNEKQRDMYFKPYEAAQETKNYQYLGYWHISPSFHAAHQYIMTYTLPLINPKDGYVFGVVGIEVSSDYFYKLLPASELVNTNNGGYAILSSSNNSDTLTPLILPNAFLRQVFPEEKPIEMKLKSKNFNGYSIDFTVPLAANYQQIQLYNRNTPFAINEWYLIGVTEESSITKYSSLFTQSLLFAFVAAIVFGILIAYITGYFFTQPISRIIKFIEGINPGQHFDLEPTHISEIDELSNAITQLNENVINHIIKTDKIIETVTLDIGSYEYQADSPEVKVSHVLAQMLKIEDKVSPNLTVNKDYFFPLLTIIKASNESSNNIYKYTVDPPKWLKIESVSTDYGEFGIIVDVTKDELEKQSIRFERDFDTLTRIYNRMAFQREYKKIFTTEDLKCSAFIMSDLDNLKYMNDTYGHDTGDLYIKTIAFLLSSYWSTCQAIVGRMSGDEFYTFVYGYDTEEEISSKISDFYMLMNQNNIILPDGNEFKLKMSSGVSWYKKDSTDADELIRFADFAMYQGKNSVKGTVREFNKDLYLSDSYMITGREELYSILDGQLIDYFFQPIVRISDGSIYGYEALMRPKSKNINTPDKLIFLAKSQGQLWKVEKVTFFMVLELFSKYQDITKDAKIFINSIPNQVLKYEEYLQIEYLYKDILHKVVVEIIETESGDDIILNKKRELLQSWKGLLALDDYGAGFSNDISLLTIQPDIIKIDKFLINQIENSTDKQAIVNKTLEFAKARNILVLAEGVETEMQLKILCHMGVDLIQGYFISRPLPLPSFDTTEISHILKTI